MNGFVFATPGASASQSSNVFSIFGQSNGRSGVSFSNGDTFDATLIGFDGSRATLRTADDFTFTVPSGSIQGNINDVLHFKVISHDKSGLALRQILPQKNEAAIERGNAGIDDIKKVSSSLEEMNEKESYRTEAQKEAQLKTAQAVAQIRRTQRFMSSNATRSAISAIAASGLDLHKIGFFTLNNLMKEIEAMPSLPRSFESLSDSAVAQLLRSGKEMTPEQIYVSRYNVVPEAPADLEAWPNLDEEIIKRFERDGIENTSRNMEAARFLAAYDLPITRKNVEASVFLRNLHLLPKVLETVRQLPSITHQDVQTVMEAKQPLDLQHLIDAEPEHLEAPAKYPVQEENLITAQRQLAEIQWQMTTQAAIRLAHKGIEINTVPLQELVAHLRDLESDAHTRILRAAGAEATQQNVARLENIFRAIQDIRPVFSHINADIQAKLLVKQVDFTLAEVKKAAAASQTQQAGLAYEASATAPNTRYGDSFARVTGQFEGLLRSLGIEPSAENIRAAAILSRSGVDVEQSSISAIKLIDAKMTAVMDRLHPMMAAQMLKEGLQPLDMHVDDMLAYIREFEEKYGYSGGQKIAQYILEMDRNKSLTPQERSGMIAVYRMLNLIRKNGSAALGLSLQQDAPLTLGSLMEAAKFYDGKGNYERTAKPPEGSIRTDLSYNDLLADTVLDKASPAALQEWLEHENNPLEDALHQKKAEAFKPDMDQAALAVKQFTESPPTIIAMLQNSGILPTPASIKSLRKEKESAMIESLSEALTELKANNPGLSALLNDQFDIEALMERIFDGDSQKEITRNLLEALSEAAPSELAAQYTLEDDEDSALPVMLNGRFASLKFYTLNEDAVAAGNARTFLSLATEALGNVQSYFTMEEGMVRLQITVDSPAARLRLESHRGLLSTLLSEAGFELAELHFIYNTASEAEPIPQGQDIAVNPEEEAYTPREVSDYEFTV